MPKPSQPTLPALEFLDSGTVSIFIRSIDTASDWNAASPEDAAREIFDINQDNSFYLVSNNEELQYTVAALNAKRESPLSDLTLVWFFPEEVDQRGISARQTPDNIPCPEAARLHHDLYLTESQAIQLCRAAFAAKRAYKKITRGSVNKLRDKLHPNNCKSYFKLTAEKKPESMGPCSNCEVQKTAQAELAQVVPAQADAEGERF